MKVVRLLSVLAVLFTASQWLQASASPNANSASIKSYGQLPLSFEPNRGQTSPEARYVAHGQGYSLFLTSSEAVLSLKSLPKNENGPLHPAKNDVLSDVVRLQLLNSNLSPNISGRDLLPGYSNYFIGKDPSQWRTRIPQYGKVEYSQVYPGIDLLYYGNQRQLEYDFVVAPGANPKTIAFQVQGSDKVEVGDQGQLVIQLKNTALELRKPVVYQLVNGERREIAASYALQADGRVSFAVGNYDFI